MVLVKRSKVRIKGIKREVGRKEKDFWHFEILRKEENKNQKEKKERRR